jgi:pimeloyl-ACP methyl ester carboxylesterase
VVTAFAAGVAVAGLASSVYQRVGERRDARRFPPLGERVDIGGRRLHVLRTGTSAPVVVVLPALGTPAVEWVRVQRALAELTDATVLVVDRAGLGWSDRGRWPRTPSTMADELRALLDALGVAEPVIVVGHSAGGLVARMFAARYRYRVGRMVLVDATHEDFRQVLGQYDPRIGSGDLWWRAAQWQARVLGWRRLRARLGGLVDLRRDAAREVPEDLVDAHIARCMTGAYRRAVVQETVGLACGLAAVRAQCRDLRELPVTVITAGAAGREQWFEGWLELQGRFLSMSTVTRQVSAAHADHHINHDDPALLARVIAEEIHGFVANA